MSTKRTGEAAVVYMQGPECVYTMECYPAIKKETPAICDNMDEP